MRKVSLKNQAKPRKKAVKNLDGMLVCLFPVLELTNFFQIPWNTDVMDHSKVPTLINTSNPWLAPLRS
jgi:hypothetical protein